MATLDVRREYADGDVLFASDFDAFLDDLETFMNTTKLGDDNLQNDSITGSTKLINATVTAVKLAADSVTTTKILDANVTTAKINDAAITTAKILDANVTAAKLATDSVTLIKIADGNINANKLATDSVTTVKIAANAVTRAKLEALGQVGSSSSGTFNTTSASYEDVTNLSVSITTTGRPVFLSLMADGSGSSAFIGSDITQTAAAGQIAFVADGSVFAEHKFSFSNANDKSSALPFTVAFSSAGTHTYKVQVFRTSGGLSRFSIGNVKLVAYEL